MTSINNENSIYNQGISGQDAIPVIELEIETDSILDAYTGLAI